MKKRVAVIGAGHLGRIHAKLLAVLLMERLSEEARFFSPWGFRLSQP